MDRISNLPNEIINLILESLSLEDQVRTSTLSSTWRLKWTCLPSLILDREFYNCLAIHPAFLEAHVDIIKSLLLQHSTSCIYEFSLFIPASRDVPTWSLYQKGIIDYVVSNYHSTLERVSLEGKCEDKELCTLTTSVFSLVNLKYLKIKTIRLQIPSWFEGFPNLIFFSLTSTTITADMVSHFVSICPRLEKVILDDLEFKGTCQKVDLKAAQLSHLRVAGRFKDLLVSNPQELVSVIISRRLYNSELEGGFKEKFNFLKSSTQLKRLVLARDACKILGFCSVIHVLPKFPLMSSLELRHVGLDKVDLQCVLSLLSCCPNLRNLYIENGSHQELHPGQLVLMIEKHIYTEFKHLVRVKMGGIIGKKSEMKIIELVLRFSPILEIMHVNFDVEKGLELKLRRAITKFHRASRKAKFHFVPINACGR